MRHTRSVLYACASRTLSSHICPCCHRLSASPTTLSVSCNDRNEQPVKRHRLNSIRIYRRINIFVLKELARVVLWSFLGRSRDVVPWWSRSWYGIPRLSYLITPRWNARGHDGMSWISWIWKQSQGIGARYPLTANSKHRYLRRFPSLSPSANRTAE